MMWFPSFSACLLLLCIVGSLPWSARAQCLPSSTICGSRNVSRICVGGLPRSVSLRSQEPWFNALGGVSSCTGCATLGTRATFADWVSPANDGFTVTVCTPSDEPTAGCPVGFSIDRMSSSCSSGQSCSQPVTPPITCKAQDGIAGGRMTEVSYGTTAQNSVNGVALGQCQGTSCSSDSASVRVRLTGDTCRTAKTIPTQGTLSMPQQRMRGPDSDFLQNTDEESKTVFIPPEEDAFGRLCFRLTLQPNFWTSDMWYTWTSPNYHGRATMDTCFLDSGGDCDTFIAVYPECPSQEYRMAEDAYTSQPPFRCNDGFHDVGPEFDLDPMVCTTDGTQDLSYLSFTHRPSTTYVIQVAYSNENCASNWLRFSSEPSVSRVFVSSTTFSGNFGGVSGADAQCQALADGAGLNGTWLAWLSSADGSVTPASRLPPAVGGFALVDGTPVADDRTALLRADATPLLHAIDMDENGVTLTSSAASHPCVSLGATVPVWTATGPAGTQVQAAGTCGDWSHAAREIPAYGQDYHAVLGNALDRDAGWTADCGTGVGHCGTQAHLYCFEDISVSPEGI